MQTGPSVWGLRPLARTAQHRQNKRQRLARPGLGDANDVASGHDRWDRLRLNAGRSGPAVLLDHFQAVDPAARPSRRRAQPSRKPCQLSAGVSGPPPRRPESHRPNKPYMRMLRPQCVHLRIGFGQFWPCVRPATPGPARV